MEGDEGAEGAVQLRPASVPAPAAAVLHPQAAPAGRRPSPQARRHARKVRPVRGLLRPAVAHEGAVGVEPPGGGNGGRVGAGQLMGGRHLQAAAALHVAGNLPGVPAGPRRLAPGQHPGEQLRGA